MQNSNNQVSVKNGIQAQQEVKKPEQDSFENEEFEALCQRLAKEMGIELQTPQEINPELLKPIESEKLFAPSDEVIEKYK